MERVGIMETKVHRYSDDDIRRFDAYFIRKKPPTDMKPRTFHKRTARTYQYDIRKFRSYFEQTRQKTNARINSIPM